MSALGSTFSLSRGRQQLRRQEKVVVRVQERGGKIRDKTYGWSVTALEEVRSIHGVVSGKLEHTLLTKPQNDERSTSGSRGRELYSTGRGGIGNFHETSSSRDARDDSGPNDILPVRGRELHVRPNYEPYYSTGRGGTGNIRSPSRDNPTETADENVVRERLADSETALPHFTGRGGLGNISRSHSRDLNASSSTVYSSGRGGVGNIHPGPAIAEAVDEDERQKLDHSHNEIHSTGRGDMTNEMNQHRRRKAQRYESTRRGGTGNVVN